MKVGMGRLLGLLQPATAQRVRQGALGSTPSASERLILAAWVDRCERRKDLDAMAPLHRWLWASQDAARHHDNMSARFERWWANGHSQILDAVAEQGGDFRHLCEIGCGAGQALRLFAERMPALDSVHGLDLSARQIAANHDADFPDNIQFVCANAVDWIPQHTKPGTIYLTVDGVYEYFARTELETLFATIAAQSPCMVALIEPVPLDYDFASEHESRPYNEERSLGHNYPALLKAAGFQVTWRTEVVDELRWCLLTAVRRPSGSSSD